MVTAAARMALVASASEPVHRLVVDVDSGRGAHLQRPLDGVGCIVRAEGQHDDLDPSDSSEICNACSTAYSSSSDSGPSLPARSTVPSGGESTFTGGVGDVFHQYDDLHLTH